MKQVSPQEIVSQFNISYQTVNYYTNLGFFKIIANEGNKRLYDNEQIRLQLERIREFRKKGYSLRVIKDELL